MNKKTMGNLLVLSLILLVCIKGRNGCLEEERKALLELKKDFVESSDHGNHSDSVLPSWVYDPQSDCCLWERVTCNSTTGHVIELSVDNLKEGETALEKASAANWSQISLFQNFEQLRILNLSFNQLPDWNTTAAYNSFSKLKWLETMDLASNNFTNNILPSLSALTSLENLNLRHNRLQGSISEQDILKAFGQLRNVKYVDFSENNFNKDIMKFLSVLPSLTSVDLSSNYLEGSFTAPDLDQLSNLKVLNLRYNRLNGTFPEGSLSKLEILDLTRNNFSGSIPPNIGALSSLKILFLSENSFQGYLPIVPGLCELKRLEELDLSSNLLQGNLPPCLNNLTSLKLLDLSKNQFDGTISPYLLPSLTSLEYIDLSQNSFEGMLSFNLTANHSKLKVMILEKYNNGAFGREHVNNLQIIDVENSSGNASFQLEILGLSNCNLKSIQFLGSQHQLKAIDLSHNKLNEKFPYWLLGNNAQLGLLNVRNNSFSGPFSLPPILMRNIAFLDISNNHFQGQIPKDIGQTLPNLKLFNLSHNSFEGDLPSSIGEMKNLKLLDLSFNNFTGEVPKELTTNCADLNSLILSNNNFSGQIFSTDFNLSYLWHLKLNNNRFSGSLTNVNFSLWEGLRVLDVSNNNMTGEIPRSFASLYSSLWILTMKNNKFEGYFPCGQDLQWLVYLDLSHNFFFGPLPSCFMSTWLDVVNLEGNKFTGSIPIALFKLGINTLFPGPVQNPKIRMLMLGNNNLSGLIPKELCELKDISMMDISNNFFSGSLPSCFSNITFGRMVDGHFPYEAMHFTIDFVSFDYGDYFVEKDVSFPIPSLLQHELEIYFTTKYLLLHYSSGGILDFMSGLDLSGNNLTGTIPGSIGGLSSIRALNLSHNHLTGPIPISFSNLSEIESLDLSNNNLSGGIPFGLTRLHSLGAFRVAHNNLSGKIPDVPQLSTFDESSYEGNPFLCGIPLAKDCEGDADEPPQSPTAPSVESEGKWYEVDLVSFFGSLAATFIMILLGLVTILYINPYWRRRWFNFIDDFIDSCYYHVHRIFY